jgi:hypothetical protein
MSRGLFIDFVIDPDMHFSYEQEKAKKCEIILLLFEYLLDSFILLNISKQHA